MLLDDDRLDFLEEDLASSAAAQQAYRPWRVLIVDDDEDVHQATVFALRDAKILGCSLEFLHAYNSISALELLKKNANIAVILLDVVTVSYTHLDVYKRQVQAGLCLSADFRLPHLG